MDDFNSSDYEDLVPPTPDPYAHLGAKSITAMLETRVEDRIRTKQRMANLQDTKGAPSTVYHRALWMKRFEAYLTLARGLSVHHTPTGDDIARFLETICGKLTPKRREMSSVCLSTMQGAVKRLYAGLVFKHKDFKLTQREYKRIDTLLDTLAKEGKLTRGVLRGPQHVGIALVRLMGQAWFTNCLTHGCRSWDVVISRFLAISLMTATAARAGDIARSRLYTGIECLRWEHIELILLDARDDGQQQQPPTLQDLTARITLAYEKNYKNLPNVDRTVIVKPLDDVQFNNNTVCPIKLLLIHALRTGHVAHTTVGSLLSSVQSTPSRTIQWINKSDPVLPAITKSGLFLDFSTPAEAGQANKTVKQTALLAGVLIPLRGHDIRAGVARDVASLQPGSIKGVGNAAVAKILGHGNSSRDRGVTDRYVGGVSTAFNELVAKQAQPDPFGPRIAAQGFRKRPIPMSETTAFCLENGLDASSEADRDRARQRIAENDQKQWARTHEDMLHTPSEAPLPHSRTPPQKRKTLEDPIAAMTTTSFTTKRTPLAQVSPNLPPAKRQRANKRATATETETAEGLDAVQAVPSRPQPSSQPTSGQLVPVPDMRIDPRLLNAEIDDVLGEDGVSDAALDSVPVDLGHVSTLNSWVFGNDNSSISNAMGGLVDEEEEEEDVAQGDDMPADEQLLRSRIEECIIDQAADAIGEKNEGSSGRGHLDPTSSKSPAAIISLPDAQFVDYFAKINVVRNQGLVEDKLKHGESAFERHVSMGNSRDKPTLYPIRCPNAPLGCDYSHERSRNVNYHVITCSKKLQKESNTPEVLEGDLIGQDEYLDDDGDDGKDVSAHKPFACDRPGCTKRFAKKKGLHDHIKRSHDWTPKKCDLPECPQPTTVWLTRSQHNVHVRDDHDEDWTPSTCSVPGCKSTHVFEKRYSYRKHLNMVHDLRADEHRPYLPSRNRPAEWPKGCPVPGCKSTSKFKQAAHLKRHLRGPHKLGEDQIESLLQESSHSMAAS